MLMTRIGSLIIRATHPYKNEPAYSNIMDNIILGTMNIKYVHSSNNDNSEYENIIHSYLNNSRNPILDSAYYYGNTQTEVVLGNILSDLPAHLSVPKVTTKANPWYQNDFTNGRLGQLSEINLKRQLDTSLINLQREQVEVFFLHCYDYETPIHETIRVCDEIWRKEKCNVYGLSNFSKTQVQEVLNVCEKDQYEPPKIYQGMYNLISRKVEELFPVMDEHNIDFWAYNPLAGGLLTGKYRNVDVNSVDSRFKNNSIYQNIFYKPEILEILDTWWERYENQSHSYLDLALQFYKQNSLLRPTDSIILGVSTVQQYENNMKSLMKDTNDIVYREAYDVFKPYYQKYETIMPNYFY